MSDLLDAFLPAVRAWFGEAFGEPTPPQTEGWPAIQRGEHTLILSPTGSGKTLAAFLWGIDQLYREVSQAGDDHEKGVRLLYVSPLKALNNDVEFFPVSCRTGEGLDAWLDWVREQVQRKKA